MIPVTSQIDIKIFVQRSKYQWEKIQQVFHPDHYNQPGGGGIIKMFIIFGRKAKVFWKSYKAVLLWL